VNWRESTPVAAYVDGMLDMFFSFIDEPELMDSYLALQILAWRFSSC
jgi:hypothetical protein